jgi:FeS assembly SUF system regulator
MRLSSLADYAVLLMRSAALHCGGARVNAASLAAETGLPVPTAQKLVGLLSKSGLIKSTRGGGGGIKLSRPAAAITLADIVEAVEGPIALTACMDPTGFECAPGAPCAVQPHWRGLNVVVRDALKSVTLASLIAVPEKPRRAAPPVSNQPDAALCEEVLP